MVNSTVRRRIALERRREPERRKFPPDRFLWIRRKIKLLRKKRRHQEGQKFEKKSSEFERITQEVGLSQGVEGSFSWNGEDTVADYTVCSAVCLFPAVPVFRCSVQKAVIGSFKTFRRVLGKDSQGRLSICHRLLKWWLLDSKLVWRSVRKGRWWTEQGKGQWTGHPNEVEGQLQREHIVGRNQGRIF